MNKQLQIIGSLLFILMLYPVLGLAQLRVLNNYKRGIFLEAGGNSVGYSLNFEQKLVNNPAVGISGRIGFGATSVDLYVPAGIQLVLFRGMHHLVISPTATARMELIGPFDFERSDTFLHLNAGIGYRFQKRAVPVFAQAQFVPGFQLDPTATQVTETPPVFQPRIGAVIGLKL